MGLARNSREEWRKTKESENEALGWACIVGALFVGWLFTKLDLLGGGVVGALLGAFAGALAVGFLYAVEEAVRKGGHQHTEHAEGDE